MPGPTRIPILRDIIGRKREEVAALLSSPGSSALRSAAEGAEPARDFFSACARGEAAYRVIAEVKRRSPSAGTIGTHDQGEGFDPAFIAGRYHAGGASAISCLTDGPFFNGSLSFIGRIKRACPLPVLRKDFIIDTAQVYEARAAGADAVLLIAECLVGGPLAELTGLIVELGMTPLIELHGEEHLDRVMSAALGAGAGRTLVGINNRDLTTMRVDLGQTPRVAERISDRSIVVSESGIRTGEDLRRLGACGVRTVLIGEHLMTRDDPGVALRELLDDAGGGHRGANQ
ncbi:MAG: indole-3-glycerol-phosphate synthase [Phycisphaeraceae bacterium]|nr:MAG: indole-3-glycerol-phosphate synthase [Phycisphaeraceae bacterium]